MMKIIFYISLSFLLSCASQKKSSKVQASYIVGSWRLITPTDYNYPTIKFTRGGAVFNSLADTIYGFSFTIRGNSLILNNGYKIYKNNKILKLTPDSLIFKSLLEKKTPQVYVRQN